MESIDEEHCYTKDGTVDYLNRPADRKKTGTWKACPFILGHECLERLAYYGMSSNLLQYFKDQLNQHSTTASKSLSNWSGTCYAMPLVGAFLADSYLGRYNTIAGFSVIYVVGMALLTLSTSIPGLKPTCHEKDTCHATSSQAALCYTALYFMALGSGAIKPCVSSYGADQFDDVDEPERARKSSFFVWFYFSINLGALVATSVVMWVQAQDGWAWGFGIPTIAMAGAAGFFFAGTRVYRYQRPGGSPLTRLCQVVVASVRKYRVVVPEDGCMLYETSDAQSAIVGSRKLNHTEQFRFLDRAAVFTQSDFNKGTANPWRLCTVTQVEELKGLLRLLPVWATGIIFSTVYGQMGNMFLLQALYLDSRVGGTHFRVPVASLTTFDTIGVMFWVIVYDRAIIPVARRFTGHRNGLTPLQRMGSGLLVSVFAMLAAAALEVARLDTVRRHGLYDVQEAPISIFWQVPQYFIIGFAEVLTQIGHLEFFYDQAPDSMRSLCSALSLTTFALGNYMSSVLVTLVTVFSTRNGGPGWIPDNLNYGHLHYFFELLAILSVLNLGLFVIVARRFTNKKTVETL
ncbi:Protein NRT1/ PTR FAMILY 8.2 [Striga hermonthica]|uniref:Protein NRT1/ PTR FAMILY 8.2 n=1 Tax=Striga hermonthica TaxID=68872 RepID=A0A9N7P2B9_STRHE|nr:Protein NRT1/ PTR FAMILY 8.2 [Striga hermonthica]